MSFIQDHDKSMLKLVQFKRLIRDKNHIDSEYIELILQDLDPNLQVTSAHLEGDYGSYLISNTLLHIAYAQESADALNILIHKGADLNVKNKTGNTVLHTAFYDSIATHDGFTWNIFENELNADDVRSQFITSILSAQVNNKNTENPSNPDGLTYFHVACATNNISAVGFFLESGVPVDQVVTKAISKQNFEGYTGLHFATQFGYLRVIEILLEHGANGNLEDAKGRTPLYISLERNIAMIDSTDKVYSTEVITENEEIIHSFINHNFLGKLPYLYIACSLQSTERLKNCLNQDIDLNINQCMSMNSRSWPGYTALHFAAHVNVNMVKLLMKHGGNIEAKDAKGVTPFDLCIERYKAKDIASVIRLVPKWKDIVLSDGKTKLTKILFAIRNLYQIQEFMKKLDVNVKLSIPFNSPLWPGFSILHIAVLLSERTKCKADHVEGRFIPNPFIIMEMLKQGGDMVTKDHRNWTPVHLAFQLNKKKILNLLLQYHYQMQNPVDDDNLSHLHIACSAKNLNLVERLLWNNVDINIPYKGKTMYDTVLPGSTPLHVAVLACEEEIAKLLLRSGADLHIPDAFTYTPLHRFLYEEFSEELGKRIFSSPILSDRLVEDVGLSYLHVACQYGNVDAVRRLLDLGVDVNQVMVGTKAGDHSNVQGFGSQHGGIPLHIALQGFHYSKNVIRLLIVRGADILARNTKGESPLEIIMEIGHETSLKVLVETLSKDVKLRRRVEAETGITPLHVACLLDDVNSIKELLNDGADVTAQIPKYKNFYAGYSPLHIAHEKLCFYTGDDLIAVMTQMSLLLKAHENFNVNPTTDAGISHFHIACHVLNFDVVEKFLQHNVDVNAAIDLFCDTDIAGCSPLLLATRATTWRDCSLAESITKLRIVDLLIKHGARVNVEDIDGDTPAHHAAFCSSKDNNYLKSLADNGADVNTRNVQGKTPLELLIRYRDLEYQELRYFIACGCIFNEFTLDTDEGYIGLANPMILQKDMESLFKEINLKYPDLMKRDCMNRTAIHNLFSTKVQKMNESKLVALVDALKRFECDVDDQDDLGRTALHIAARRRNEVHAKALFLVGADFSITDNDQKTPFDYLFEPCMCTNKHRFHEEEQHSEIANVFAAQVRKMLSCDLDVDKINVDLLAKAEQRFNFRRLPYDMCDFRSEFKKLVRIKIEPYSIRLGDFMSSARDVDYSRMPETKRDVIDTFFYQNKTELRCKFPNAAGIFQLQYRQAVMRRKRMEPAKASLSILAGFQVPDVCSDIILRFLGNLDLQKLIASTKGIENKNVDTKSHGVVKNKKPRFQS